MRRSLAIPFLAAVLAATPATATTITFALSMTGAQEVPGPGDPNGTATGTMTFDDVTGGISWNLTYANIVAPGAMHIHGPGGPAGTAATILVPLSVSTTGGAGTLIGQQTGPASNVTSILANPTDFYVNIHNEEFPDGAVRGQLGVVPEPGTAALLLAAIAIGLRRRH